MNIAFFSTKPYDREYFDPISHPHHFSYFDLPLNIRTVALAKGCEAVCVFVNDVLDAPVIEQLAEIKIRLIVLRCAGFNNVDLNAANRQNIVVMRVPAYSPEAVAEHAVALMLTLNRKTHKAYNRVREGNFALDKLTGFNLRHKTVGVVGTGKIGAAFCEIMLGFGCRVIAFDLIANRQLETQGITYLPLIDLLQQSDIVSLHCPLTQLTQHLMNVETLSYMKPGAMLINTSRGALLDAKAAIGALKTGQLGYLGIDVYEQEEKLFFSDHSGEIIQDDLITRLISFPNVLITAHQGFFTVEALTEIARITLSNINNFLTGTEVANRI